MTRLLFVFDSMTSITLDADEPAFRLVQWINNKDWSIPDPLSGLIKEKSIHSLKAVALGEWVFVIAESDASDTQSEAPTVLSKRQQQVLGMLSEGMTNKQIALKLNLSQRMVNMHLSAIKFKLGTKTNAQSVSKGTALGYFRPFMRRREY